MTLSKNQREFWNSLKEPAEPNGLQPSCFNCIEYGECQSMSLDEIHVEHLEPCGTCMGGGGEEFNWEWDSDSSYL